MANRGRIATRHREVADLLVCGLVLVTAVAGIPKPFGFRPRIRCRSVCTAFPAADVIVAVIMLDLELVAVVEWTFAEPCGAHNPRALFQSISFC